MLAAATVAWKFATSPLGRYLGVALAVFALLASVHRCGFVAGVRQELGKEAKAQAAADVKVKALNTALNNLGLKDQQELAQAQAANQTRTETLIKKVPYYVTRKADAACTINLGAVRLWNAGAGGQAGLPSAPGGPDEAPSGVSLSDFIAADLYNFGVAYDYKAEALKWRSWYPEAKAKWEASH